MKKTLLLSLVAFIIHSVQAQTDTATATKKKFDFEKTKNQRYLSTDEIGALTGLSGHAAHKTFFSYQTVNEWQLERHIYVGPGTGFEATGKSNVLLNNSNSKSALMIPLFVEMRVSFLSTRVSPYFSAKTGYAFYLGFPNPSLTGGGFVEGQLGIKTFITRNASFNFSAGYRLQCLGLSDKYAVQFSDIMPGSNTKTAEYFNFLSIHAGFCY